MDIHSKSECRPGIAHLTRLKQGTDADCLQPTPRKKSWPLVKEPQVILYHPREDKFSIEKEADLQNCKKNLSQLMRCDSLLTTAGGSKAINVPLPKWCNRVSIYLDPINKSQFVASVRISRIGWIKNWQRRTGRNYTSLYISTPLGI